ncbi:Single-stranded DNA-binding replication protein A (RPA), large (70 kD) subunit-related ssDNA-binding protein [Thermoplasmatales archaeon BRNA1]|nr:Single-stranded DNA-binding replication protein A (RPA), large (70 kD) subunit-related ssDNA-binding protein [Thermoplasmatales archaeon BRNA1]
MTEQVDLTPYVDEIFETLKGEVPKEKLLEDMKKYVFQYEIGIDAAKSGIIKKYNAPKNAVRVSGAAVTKKVAELTGSEVAVNVTAKILFVAKKEINAKGVSKTIISGIAGDETGSTNFTIWSDAGEFQAGQVYVFKNAYTKMFRDQAQINIGARGSVELAEGVVIDNVPRMDGQPSGSSAPRAPAAEMKIGEITENTSSATVVGKILSVETRNITVKGEARTVWGGLIADSSGKIQFTAWDDHNLSEGQTVRIENAYIRSWKGIPQLNIGNSSTVTDTEADLGEVAGDGTTSKTVQEITEIGGGLDISITGTIVDVKTGSGLIKRCPECNRSILNEDCAIHGHVDSPVIDLRLKTTIDDGTGAISVIINRRDTEAITGMTLEEAQDLAREKGDMGVVANKMAAAVLLKKVTVTGNIMTDEKFGPQMSARSTVLTNTDVKAEAERLYSEMEGAL